MSISSCKWCHHFIPDHNYPQDKFTAGITALLTWVRFTETMTSALGTLQPWKVLYCRKGRCRSTAKQVYGCNEEQVSGAGHYLTVLGSMCQPGALATGAESALTSDLHAGHSWSGGQCGAGSFGQPELRSGGRALPRGAGKAASQCTLPSCCRKVGSVAVAHLLAVCDNPCYRG